MISGPSFLFGEGGAHLGLNLPKVHLNSSAARSAGTRWAHIFAEFAPLDA
jgi:hypothetical protein